jgi:transposase
MGVCRRVDLTEFYDRIKARGQVAGRPATDRRVVLAVWLYATMEGIGAARAIDRLCRPHAAYRWLCGGAPINHDLLASFRPAHCANSKLFRWRLQVPALSPPPCGRR